MSCDSREHSHIHLIHKQSLQEETCLSCSVEHISETANAFKLQKLICDAGMTKKTSV